MFRHKTTVGKNLRATLYLTSTALANGCGARKGHRARSVLLVIAGAWRRRPLLVAYGTCWHRGCLGSTAAKGGASAD